MIGVLASENLDGFSAAKRISLFITKILIEQTQIIFNSHELLLLLFAVQVLLAHSAFLGSEEHPESSGLAERLKDEAVHLGIGCVCIDQHILIRFLIKHDLKDNLLKLLELGVLVFPQSMLQKLAERNGC